MVEFPQHKVLLWPTAALMALAALAITATPLASTAFAEDIDTDPEVSALQQQVESTAIAYDEAVAAAQAADQALSENSARIAELEALIPAQQARSDAAARELYKFQQQNADVIDLVLSADDFFDLLTSLDYINRITEANVAEVTRLNALKTELAGEQEALQQAKREADESAAEAERALAAAQEARLEAQRKAQEAARQAAEANAIAKSAASNGSASTTQASSDDEAAQDPGSSTTDAGAEAAEAVSDGADWSSDEAAFVDSWASRIDDYLSGSPLAGQGRTFAQAAWNYGVDPRWSPAIAYTESSLGAYCFLPHNAWGWGSVSWDSWEEAIDEHVRGLARGYGYTISMDAANKYCPPTAQSWYNTTLAQMNMI